MPRLHPLSLPFIVMSIFVISISMAAASPPSPESPRLLMDPPTQAELAARWSAGCHRAPDPRLVFYDQDGDGSPESPAV